MKNAKGRQVQQQKILDKLYVELFAALAGSGSIDQAKVEPFKESGADAAFFAYFFQLLETGEASLSTFKKQTTHEKKYDPRGSES